MSHLRPALVGYRNAAGPSPRLTVGDPNTNRGHELRETYYDILHIKPGATLPQVHRAYRSQARKYHPDVDNSADANQRMARINLAYETLSDPDRKARYDLEIGAGVPPSAGPAHSPGTAHRAQTKRSDRAHAQPRAPRWTPPSRPSGAWFRAVSWAAGSVVLALFAYLSFTLGDQVPGSIDSIGRVQTEPRGNAVEQCYLDHPRGVQGDAAEKALLDQCLLEAKAIPTPPASPMPSESPAPPG